MLGVFPRRRWPSADTSHEAGRAPAAYGDVLVRGRQPDERTGALVALLVGHRPGPQGRRPRGPVRRGGPQARAKEIAEGDWAAKAVKDAIAAATAAVAAVAVGGAVVASSSG